MNPDFLDLLRALSDAEARFLIVGAYALAHHARPRATGDLDVWIDPTAENAARVHRALRQFGAPLTDLTAADLARPDLVYQMGLAPRRIDILTSLTALDFVEAWSSKIMVRVDGLECFVLGREALIKNKRALGRARDLADLEALGD